MKTASTFWLIGLFAVGACAAEEPALFDEARRALAEAIPQVAIQKLTVLRAQPNLSADQRAASALLLSRGAARRRAVRRGSAHGATAGHRRRRRSGAAAGAHPRERGPLGGGAADLRGGGESAGRTRRGASRTRRGAARPRPAHEAMAVLESFVREHPRAITSRLRLAGLLIESGQKPSRAQSLLAGIHAAAAGRSELAPLSRGRLLLLEKKPVEALAIFEELSDDAGASHGESARCRDARDDRGAGDLERLRSRRSRAREFIWKYPDSAFLEAVFRRLDQIYAQREKSAGKRTAKVGGGPEARRARAGALTSRGCSCAAANWSVPRSRSDAFLARLPGASAAAARASDAGRMFSVNADVSPRRMRALEAAERRAGDEELRAEIELRTRALLHSQQGEYLLAANHFEARRAALPEAAADRDLRRGAGDPAPEELRPLFRAVPRAQRALPESPLARRSAARGRPRCRRARAIRAPRRRCSFSSSTFPSIDAAGRSPAGARGTGLPGWRSAGGGALSRKPRTQPPRTPETRRARGLSRDLSRRSKKSPRRDEASSSWRGNSSSAIPHSPLLPEVRMKLGQVYFRNERQLANAETQFATLAQETPEQSVRRDRAFPRRAVRDAARSIPARSTARWSFSTKW